MKPARLVVIMSLLSAATAHSTEIKPYGFILANYIQHFGRPNIADVPTQAVSDGNIAPPNQNLSVFHVRQTRLGLNLTGGKGPRDADLSGTIEADFWGLRAANSGANDVLQAGPRLRLAFVQAKLGEHAVVFGQDWVKAFAPLNAWSLMHQAVPVHSNSGNLWNRLPQLRWDARWILNAETSIGTKLALARSFSGDQAGRAFGSNGTQIDAPGSGESSGGPAYQALAEVQRSVGGRVFVLGASMQYLRQSFNSLVTAPAGSTGKRVDGLLGSTHFVLPLCSRFEISGEGFYGRSDQNLQGLGAIYNDLGDVRTSQTRGGWVQGALKLSDTVKAHVSAGFENLDRTGLAAASIYRNETILANAAWDMAKDFTVSVEFGRIHSYFVSAPSGDSMNAGLAAQYRF